MERTLSLIEPVKLWVQIVRPDGKFEDRAVGLPKEVR
ncbi:MAG: hypothetical protein ACI9BS_000734 [Candidatus Poriferisodalaceae bacterium]|jgi:hypothetical protein